MATVHDLGMRGFDPRIHPETIESFVVMDCRVKPGNDKMDVFSTGLRLNRRWW
jgi:hypothetical protein